MWKDHDVPERFLAAQASWRRHHPDWEYRLWTHEDLDRFVADYYPHCLALFESYPDQIQRVDSARYMILHHYGGFYADLDVVCERSLEGLRHHDVVLPSTEPLGVSVDLMGGQPGSAFFAYAIAQLPRAKRWSPRGLVPRHFRVLLSTGSLFMTLVLMRWKGPEKPFIIPAEQYRIAGHPDALVSHIHGGTWQERDSDVLTFLYYRGKELPARLRAALGLSRK
jgi:mannosyltransferase OCH1-like enzyme